MLGMSVLPFDSTHPHTTAQLTAVNTPMESGMAIGADRDSIDASTFLDEYFRARGMDGAWGAESPELDQVLSRATSARERFKIQRQKAAVAAENGHHDKHRRRLANNRKSAAATRVYNGVLVREREHALESATKRARLGERRLSQLYEKMATLKSEAQVMNARIAALEALIADVPRLPPSQVGKRKSGKPPKMPHGILKPTYLPTIENSRRASAKRVAIQQALPTLPALRNTTSNDKHTNNKTAGRFYEAKVATTC